jgi:hypothetical protein
MKNMHGGRLSPAVSICGNSRAIGGIVYLRRSTNCAPILGHRRELNFVRGGTISPVR